MRGDPRFADGKEADALRTIGEVAAALGIKQHVLRYWEQQFPMLRPLKRSGGRRYYRPEDIRIVDTIDRLVNRERYTLRGARQALESEVKASASGQSPAPAATPAGPPQSLIHPMLVAHLRAIRQNLAAALD